MFLFVICNDRKVTQTHYLAILRIYFLIMYFLIVFFSTGFSDRLFELRIKLQKPLQSSSRYPQCENVELFQRLSSGFLHEQKEGLSPWIYPTPEMELL